MYRRADKAHLNGQVRSCVIQLRGLVLCIVRSSSIFLSLLCCLSIYAHVWMCVLVYMCESTQGHGLGVRSLCFASSGGGGSHQLVVSGGDDMVIKLWDQRMKSAVASMSGHK